MLSTFAPFIGTILIFNDHVIELFHISTMIGTAQDFTINYLKIIYFGLVFLGIGSFLFGIFCYEEIKINDSISEYIEREKKIITDHGISLLVLNIATDYILYNTDLKEGRFCLNRYFAYPESLQFMIDAVFSRIVKRIDGLAIESELNEGHPYPSISALDNAITENIAMRLKSRLRYDRAFWTEFDKISQTYAIDLLQLRYMTIDRSNPLLRLIISISYFIGFSILFFPTIKTFVHILFKSTSF